jgi:hypothetical protein
MTRLIQNRSDEINCEEQVVTIGGNLRTMEQPAVGTSAKYGAFVLLGLLSIIALFFSEWNETQLSLEDSASTVLRRSPANKETWIDDSPSSGSNIVVDPVDPIKPSTKNESSPDEKTKEIGASNELNSGPRRNIDAIKELQKQNYKNGTALMLNIHITHHGGTAFCGRMRLVGPTPERFCANVNDEQAESIPDFDAKEYDPTRSAYRPWSYNDTSQYIAINRKYFHMVSWEFGILPKPSLHATNWEDPNLVSVAIIRHPISRLLAGDGIKNSFNLTTEKGWWDYSNGTDHCDNFCLRRLSDRPSECCQGEFTSRTHLKAAKKLLQRFTFVIDIACLDAGMEAMAWELGFELPEIPAADHSTNLPYRERVGFDDVYDFLLSQNKLDIELYEWSKKKLGLVDCENLKA